MAGEDDVGTKGVIRLRFQVRDAEQLAMRLAAVRSLTPTRRDLIADAAQKNVLEHFPTQRVVAGFEALYDT
jgi:hypothetical protein